MISEEMDGRPDDEREVKRDCHRLLLAHRLLLGLIPKACSDP